MVQTFSRLKTNDINLEFYIPQRQKKAQNLLHIIAERPQKLLLTRVA